MRWTLLYVSKIRSSISTSSRRSFSGSGDVLPRSRSTSRARGWETLLVERVGLGAAVRVGPDGPSAADAVVADRHVQLAGAHGSSSSSSGCHRPRPPHRRPGPFVVGWPRLCRQPGHRAPVRAPHGRPSGPDRPPLYRHLPRPQQPQPCRLHVDRPPVHRLTMPVEHVAVEPHPAPVRGPVMYPDDPEAECPVTAELDGRGSGHPEHVAWSRHAGQEGHWPASRSSWHSHAHQVVTSPSESSSGRMPKRPTHSWLKIGSSSQAARAHGPQMGSLIGRQTPGRALRVRSADGPDPAPAVGRLPPRWRRPGGRPAQLPRVYVVSTTVPLLSLPAHCRPGAVDCEGSPRAGR